jgi:proteasome lid subunit RPN8/RPN11
MEYGTETAVGTWSAPECPFEIEYSVRVLDEIRLAVADAFFSLPRGGAEIGGILLGKRDGDRISITDYEALDCEHATGPSFTLSARDQTNLAEMTAKARRNASNRQPVGWYHSHTRSGIFLSDIDQEIHKRYFPEPWQVALVLKPHIFEPTRGGFFFREADGSMHGDASYAEFELNALPRAAGLGSSRNSLALHRTLPEETESRGAAVPLPPPSSESPVLPMATPAAPPPTMGKARVPITREIALDPPAVDAPKLDAPDFGQTRRERPLGVMKSAAILAVGLAAGGIGYQTRQFWLPRVLAQARAVLPKEPANYLSLAVSDDNGQLKIQWDRNAPAVRNASDATIEINDGTAVPRLVLLDAPHLAAGSFTYARSSEHVDVWLMASEPGGQQVKEQATFSGKAAAAPKETAEDPVQVKAERDAAVERADKLQKDLNIETAKARKLEKDLKEVRTELQIEQRGRMSKQN